MLLNSLVTIQQDSLVHADGLLDIDGKGPYICDWKSQQGKAFINQWMPFSLDIKHKLVRIA